MCGIFGTNKHTHEENLSVHVKEILNHRGPDYHGVFEDSHMHLSHLLLAIRGDIDDSTQPVYTKRSPWVLVFNGQLYNTEAIKNTLSEMTPETTVDTHLLYALIEMFGWDFITYIHGMFTIALYNTDTHILKLYRDQSGQKNLYYAHVGTHFSFASEIKGLLEISHIPREIDRPSVQIASTFGYIPGNRTLIKDIFKLNPSEELTYNCTTNELTRHTFVSKGEGYFHDQNPDQVLKTVISEHLQSNRDVSINLSGGLDSSLIFHEAINDGCSIRAFSTFFDGASEKYNIDALLAEKLAHDYGQKFTKITITKESYLAHLTRSYETIEEPNFNISVPIYYQTAVTEGIQGEGLRVVLSGDGGDELFGGYPHYLKVQRIEQFKKLLTTTGVNLYKNIREGRGLDYGKITDIFYAIRAFSKNYTDERAESIFVRAYLDEVTAALIDAYQSKSDDVYRLMLIDRFVWLTSENFIRSDKLYMSQSMEMRCPLSYTPLRTYMDSHITSKEYISTTENKIFLRNLYKDKLPDYITKRGDKSGWRAPVELWYDERYKKKFLEIISSAEHIACGVNWKQVKKHIESTETWPGKEMHLYLSLSLLINKYKHL